MVDNTSVDRQDEIIEVKLPRRDYETLRTMLERERTYSNITNYLKSFWVWAVAGGILTIWALWDQLFKGGIVK